MSAREDPIKFLVDKPTSSPEWLAMTGYGLLIYLYLDSDTSIRTLSTISGYSLLFLSKFLKSKDATDQRVKILQTWGYIFVILGLSFTQWRDAVAVFAYGLAIADVEAANALIAFVLALNLRDSGNLAMVVARLALIMYNV